MPWDGAKFQFADGSGRLSLKGKITYDGAAGLTVSTLTELKPEEKGYIDYVDVSRTDGLIAIFGRDEDQGTLPARVFQTKFPFAGLLQTGQGVAYLSAANNDGCEKCHTDPYLKHGYIYGQVNADPATDFLTCKACHLDNGAGGHFEWQLLVDDPAKGAAYLAGEYELTEAETAQYAYETNLMNDVHMSHAMEFPYPQSMSNCVACHADKLDVVLADANFQLETCKSCCRDRQAVGPIKEAEEVYETTALALLASIRRRPTSMTRLDLTTVTPAPTATKWARRHRASARSTPATTRSSTPPTA